MKIAISGKGGAGKTTISATLARSFAQNGHSVLAIDGDPSPNLGIALGLRPANLDELTPLPRTLMEEQADAQGNRQLVLTKPIEAITTEHGMTTEDGVTLLLGVRVDHPGAG